MKKILAIDDNAVNLQLLKELIKRSYPDFTMVTAENGRDGIELASREIPDLILLDVLMPGMDGVEVCEIIKANEAIKHIPILMVSALGNDPSERARGLNAGANAFISKPVHRAELQAQINVALRIKAIEDLLRKRNNSLETRIKEQTNRYLLSEERFLQISERALEFYWEINAEGIFSYISPVIERILNKSAEKITGQKKFYELFQLKQFDYDDFVEEEQHSDVEHDIQVKGKTMWLSFTGFSTFDKAGNYTGKRGVCYVITKRKQAEIALKENLKRIEDYQKRLKRLNAEITRVEERERRRIAESLHENLGQNLSLAYLKLSTIRESINSPEGKKVVDDIAELLNISIAETRSLTYDLSPPILYELGLIQALKWKLEQITGKFDIETVLYGEQLQVQIPEEHKVFLYRTVCELLVNVIKHARAKLILVEIGLEKGNLTIAVRDNGVGLFNKQKKYLPTNGGFGLMNITEKLESMNGKLEIDSEPGVGTVAKIIIPLHA